MKVPPSLRESAPSGRTGGGAHPDLARLLRLWFSLQVPVGPRAYALTGVSLMLFKYGVDASLAYAVTGRFFSPFDYLNPLLSMRQQALNPAPSWLLWVMAAWTLPFLWIGASMSVRRAMNAGRSAWIGTLFFIPILNYLAMIVLCLLPAKTGTLWSPSPPRAVADEKVKSALLGILFGVLIALAMTGLSIYLIGSYGAALFFGTPFLIGAVSTYLYNHGHPRTFGSTVAVGLLSIALSASALLLFALEGLLCILMAAPLAAVIGLFGALIGRAIALSSSARASQAAVALALLPLLAGAETVVAPRPLFEVVSTIEIDAPPARVWPNLVGFSELPEPERWFFRAGIAYPQRAQVEGSGVGAVRRCEFSTGPFIEPITSWEAPFRLAFDVRQQPPTMHEWSPYRRVYPPHLDGTLRSRRGEFRLIALPGNRTRLEGRTWYELEMHPQSYWALWSDALIHSIHERVLRHIKRLSEGSPRSVVDGSQERSRRVSFNRR